MYLGLCLISVIAVVWAITAMPTRPKAETVKPRDLERRDAQLRACPDRVTKSDVDRVLGDYPLSAPTIARVLGTAAERGVSPRTMWCWADRFGADKLVLALDADVAERRLRRYLDAGTAPDWAAMSVFAGLNNDTGQGAAPAQEILDHDLDSVPASDELDLDLSGWETPDVPATAVADVDLSQFSHLPPIYDPGLPVTRSATPPARQSAGSERHAGGDDDWSRVA